MILDEHNVYWELLRYEMVNAPFFKTWLGRRVLVRKWLVPRLMEHAKSFEIAALRKAIRTLVSSESDRNLVLAELPELGGRIRVLPNCIDLERIPQSVAADNTNNVVFVANYNYIPNREAAFYVSSTLAPALPEARFLLVGSDPPIETARVGNVVITGYVQNLQSVFRTAAVCIAPLVHGSGTRLKILTYLAAGKAVVATTKACEGLEVQDDVHLLIRDDPESFQSAIRRVLGDPSLRKQLGDRGRALVEAKYDWRVYVDWLKEFAMEVRDASRIDGVA